MHVYVHAKSQILKQRVVLNCKSEIIPYLSSSTSLGDQPSSIDSLQIKVSKILEVENVTRTQMHVHTYIGMNACMYV